MRLLFLTFYFEPDLSAGSFRSSSLLKKLVEEDMYVDVISTVPNRYNSYKSKANAREVYSSHAITRINIPNHHGGMLSQAIAFTNFYIKTHKIIKHGNYDAVYATSSRLFTAFLGARISKSMKIPLYLDIRDIFVDTMKDVLSLWVYKVIEPILKFFEKYTFNQAKHINLVSEGFKDYFQDNFKCNSYSFFSNGIDEIFLNTNINNVRITNEINTILYAGNIGEGQGLHKIIPDLAKIAKNYNFTIIGDGGSKKKLVEATSKLKNVKILEPVSRDRLISYYMNSDCLLIHLNDYDAFKKVLPSKIFEYGAIGKPILAGVSGFSKDFINTHVSNAAVFKPCDHDDAMKAILKIKTFEKSNNRDKFIKEFNRSKIMNEMKNSIRHNLFK